MNRQVRMHMRIVGQTAYTVHIYTDHHATMYAQHVNPATGKGWQKHHSDMLYTGVGAAAKAMRAWLYAGK